MADHDNTLDQIAVGQAQPAVTANELFDALSPAACFGRRNRSTAGLMWGFYGGRYLGLKIDHGQLAMATNATNYIVVERSSGIVSASTLANNWDDHGTYTRLYEVTTNATDIIAWKDYRQIFASTLDIEFFQDVIANLLVAGSGMSIVYDDDSSPPAVHISATGASSDEHVQDLVGALVQAGDHIAVTYNDAASPASLVISNTRPGMSQEQMEDFIAAFLQPGIGVSLDYDDAASPATLVVNATAGDPEVIQDIVGALVVAGDFINVTYNDSASPPQLVIRNTRPGVTQEQIEDYVASLIQAGDNVSIQYNDGDSPASLVISATAGSGASAGSFFISETDPAGSPSPESGARWLKPSTGVEYTWVTNTWVQLH